VSETGASAVELLVDAALAACSALEGAQEELCRLDAVAGDGDEGFAMASAARGIRAEFAKAPPADVASLLSTVASQFSAVGGTMGALSFVLFRSLAQTPGLGEKALSAGAIAELLAVAEESLSAFGGAKRGDKTIIDAIAGAREAAEACAAEAKPAQVALTRSAEAARSAAAETAAMVPRVGRASRLSEQSRGTVDPGAQSFAIALTALADSYAAATGAGRPDVGAGDEPEAPREGGN
jgi:dihydroxyacetone kinase